MHRYICQMMKRLVGSFYKKYVKPLPANETPPEIKGNPKLYPYFKDCRGGIDGSHFDAWVCEEAIPCY